jgi:thiamine-phosphate pyrophosphorylase
VLVNDRTDIAIAAGAAGVHLGPEDLHPAMARKIAPQDFIIGVSVGSEAEVPRGAAGDYWGIGPLHISSTKHDAGKALAWGGVRALLARSGGKPCVVIGGVVPGDLPAARAAGMSGVAVVSGILASSDVRQAAKVYSLSWNA